MLLHGNARLSPFQRQLVCERVRVEGWTIEEAAHAAGCSERTVYRWLTRHDAGESMLDRSSAPHCRPTRTPPKVERQIERLRRLRWTSTRIAATLEMAVSTVCAVLVRLGLNRLWKLGPVEPPNRYCRRHAGELVHLDVKKLGKFWRPGHRSEGTRQGTRNRGAGWEFVHVAVDDTTRLAYAEVLPSERGDDTVAFLGRALEFFARYGITVRALLTDNGANYRALVFAAECRDRNLRHLRTQPYRPQTNGKAERFIQTMLREWAYAARYPNSAARIRALPGWIDYYNHQRPHGALSHQAPVTRLQAD
jgi:transposase InsO family protein